MCTTIKNDYDVQISTIEHLMAAFSGTGLDNVDTGALIFVTLSFGALESTEDDTIFLLSFGIFGALKD